jgi:homogentisate 1,2-dioxygenase
MSFKTSDIKEYQNIFHWAETQKDGSIPSFAVRKNDPYEVPL